MIILDKSKLIGSVGGAVGLGNLSQIWSNCSLMCRAHTHHLVSSLIQCTLLFDECLHFNSEKQITSPGGLAHIGDETLARNQSKK